MSCDRMAEKHRLTAGCPAARASGYTPTVVSTKLYKINLNLSIMMVKNA